MASTSTRQDENARPSAAWRSRRRLFALCLVVAGLVMVQYRFWQRPSGVDRANWDYFAQVIARGGAPYRDVVNIKTPLSAYIGAAAIVVARPFGVRDLIAIRVVFVSLAIATVGLLFLVVSDWSRDLRVGVVAAAVLLSVQFFGVASSGGVQPKTPMIAFGLLTLWAAHRGRFFLAGACGMLSALSWQPGLLFLGAAGVAIVCAQDHRRAIPLGWLIVGALAPVVLLVIHLWGLGALLEFYRWTLEYPATVYGPRELRPIGASISRVTYRIIVQGPTTTALFGLGAIGVILTLLRAAAAVPRVGANRALVDLLRQAFVMSGLTYLGFCAINFQGRPDLIPIMPFVAGFAAVTIVAASDGLARHLTPRAAGRPGFPAGGVWIVAPLVLVLLTGWHAAGYRVEPLTLADQDAAMTDVMSHLGPGDSIYVHGKTEMLVLRGLTNASPHYLFDREKDLYLDRVEPGGFRGWLDRLKAARPKIVALGRLEQVVHASDLTRWVAADYDLRVGPVFTYYVRRD